jgi:ferrous iron transport protein A
MTTSTSTDSRSPNAPGQVPSVVNAGPPAVALEAPETMHAPMRVLVALDRLAVGAKAMISSVAGETALRRRLLEMGLGPGIVVTLIRRAPMGDPLELLVRDYQLSVRGDQAKLITVIPIPAERV